MKLLGLIGYPLTHSFSEVYFKEKFRRENIEGWDYKLFPLEHISDLPQLIDEHPQLCGLNVTIPYKVEVMPYIDAFSPEAEAIGAVNTIRINGGRLRGYNTDVHGFEQSLKPLLKPHHKSALVLGAGGAAKAVAYVLKKLNIPFMHVSRESGAGKLTYDMLTPEHMQQNLLIINTTPLGMYPDVESLPAIPYQFIGNKHLLYDLVYNPEETLFLKRGKQQGAGVKNGNEMLVLQAEKAWELWSSPRSRPRE